MRLLGHAYKIMPTTLEECRDKYYHDILTLWKNNLAITCSARFEWFYLQNPMGPARTWIAVEAKTAKVIGLASVYPRGFSLEQRPIRIGSAIDISVEREHRNFGPAIAMTQRILAEHREHGFDFILAAPNALAIGVFRMAGYKRLGEQMNWVKALKTKHLILRRLNAGPLAAIVGGLADSTLKILDRLKYVPDFRKDWTAETLKYCDERFDDLWARIKTRRTLHGVKNAAYLNWRYADCMTMDHSFFCVFDREHRRLKAFLVYTLKEHTAIVTDLVAEDYAESLDTLLLNFIRRMRRGDASHISLCYLGDEAFTRKLRKFNFIQRNVARRCLLYLHPDYPAYAREKISDWRNWTLFEGDLDL